MTENNDNNLPNKPSWKARRRIIYATLIFCAFCIGYILFKGQPTSLNEIIVLSCFGLAGSVIGSYVFGAVWDDKNFMEQVSKRN